MDDDNSTNDGPSFEQWMAFYNETVAFERKIGIIIPSIFALIIVVGVVGNLLVVVVALNRAMRNSTNTLIIGKILNMLCFCSLIIFSCFSQLRKESLLRRAQDNYVLQTPLNTHAKSSCLVVSPQCPDISW
ncbi:unnamed protein product [Heligmosomoides polygyrus]|uniref:G_PROTEIN_RECEP_F1_2 domain-containing protein n=1 Tax=Heligmosomoides polygyrus TaxID=6339 RepID=A0A183F1U9_HELPZ|nr:unnamed protein product [Heligmosomoides polygyrus]